MLKHFCPKHTTVTGYAIALVMLVASMTLGWAGPANAIEGFNAQVVNAAGTPQGGVLVTVLSAGSTIATGTSDMSGSLLLDLEPGTYDVSLEPPADSPYGMTTLLAVAFVSGDVVDLVLVGGGGPTSVVWRSGWRHGIETVPVDSGYVILEPTEGATPSVTSSFAGAETSVPVFENTIYRVYQLFAGSQGTTYSTPTLRRDWTAGPFTPDQLVDGSVDVAAVQFEIRDTAGNPVTDAVIDVSTSVPWIVDGVTIGAHSFSGMTPSTGMTGRSSTWLMPIGVGEVPARLLLPNGIAVPVNIPNLTNDRTVSFTVDMGTSVVWRSGWRHGIETVPVDSGYVILEPTEGATPSVTSSFAGAETSVPVFENTIYRVYQLFAGSQGTTYSTPTLRRDWTAGPFTPDQLVDGSVDVAAVQFEIRDTAGNPVTDAVIDVSTSVPWIVDGVTIGAHSFSGMTPSTGMTGRSSTWLMPIGVGEVPARLLLPNGIAVPVNIPNLTNDRTVSFTVDMGTSVVWRSGWRHGIETVPVDSGYVILEPTEGATPSVTSSFAGAETSVPVFENTIYRVYQLFAGSQGTTYSTPTLRRDWTAGPFTPDQLVDGSVDVAAVQFEIRDTAGNPVTDAVIDVSTSVPWIVDGVTIGAHSFSGMTPSTGMTGRSSTWLMPIGVGEVPARLLLPNGIAVPVNIPNLTSNALIVFAFTENGTVLLVDTQAPLITGHLPDGQRNGWYNQPVSVTWSVSDPAPSAGLPVDSNPESTLVSSEGADQVIVSEPACDVAGFCSTGLVRVSVDRTSPTAGIIGPVDGAIYDAGAVPPATCAASDSLSGVADCTISTPAIAGDQHTISLVATDLAGNTTSTNMTYTVRSSESALLFGGFLEPITSGTANRVKGGATVPVKWRVTNSSGAAYW